MAEAPPPAAPPGEPPTPPGAPARPPRGPATAARVAYEVLRRVEQGGAYATLAVDGALRKTTLSASERTVVPELVYGVLRQRTRLDRALAAHAPRGLGGLSPAALAVLRIAAYQILCSRLPAPLAVDGAVRDMRTLAGDKLARFANALLRKLATAGEPPPPAELIARLEAVHSLPPWLGARLVASLGAAEAEACAAAFVQPPQVALRVALDRTSRDALAAELAVARPHAMITPSPLVPEALLVQGGGAPEQWPAFLDGRCTVQDVAAQLVARVAGFAAGETILDACSGVGGKAAHLASLARAAGVPIEIHAADTSRRKLDLAEESARRLGLGKTIYTTVVDLLDPAERKRELAKIYDRVLLDAPCSGLGVLRRHPEAKWRADFAGKPAELAALQARLLDGLAPLVKPGGVLVYSVCTFTEEEGPSQLAHFLARHRDFTLAPPPPEQVAGVDLAQVAGEQPGMYRTWPHRHEADAFFVARLLRRAG